MKRGNFSDEMRVAGDRSSENIQLFSNGLRESEEQKRGCSRENRFVGMVSNPRLGVQHREEEEKV